LIDVNEPAAGVRLNGIVAGYILCDELNEGICADYYHEFEASSILEGSASISELIHALEHSPRVFVRLFGSIAGIATREDLQDPPVRMWLFGLVTVIELHFRKLVARHFDGDGWMHYLSPERIDKAKKLLVERQRRGQNPRLLA
jgi:hypothetical protein